MEKDDEWLDGANAFEYRIYDSRIGRFLSVDPLNSKHPDRTGFDFSANNPIMYIDKFGLKEVKAYISLNGQRYKLVFDTDSPQELKIRKLGLFRFGKTRTLSFKGSVAYLRSNTSEEINENRGGLNDPKFKNGVKLIDVWRAALDGGTEIGIAVVGNHGGLGTDGALVTRSPRVPHKAGKDGSQEELDEFDRDRAFTVAEDLNYTNTSSEIYARNEVSDNFLGVDLRSFGNDPMGVTIILVEQEQNQTQRKEKKRKIEKEER